MALYSNMLKLQPNPDGKSAVGSAANAMNTALQPKPATNVPSVGRMGTWAGIRQLQSGSRPVAGVPGVPQAPGSMPNVNPISATPIPNAPAAPVAPPPPVPLPVQSNTAQLSRIDPSNDLRGVMIAPQAGPSRQQIALDRLKAFDMNTADERARGIRDIGRSAASLGRLNSGMVTTDLGSLEERLQRAREQMLLNLSAGTAEGEIGDARYDRGELRGERDYQTGRADNAIDRNIQQRMLEESILGNEWNRNRVLADRELDYSREAGASSDSALGALEELIRNRAAGQIAGSQQGVLDQIGQAKPPTSLPPIASANIPRSILDLLKVG